MDATKILAINVIVIMIPIITIIYSTTQSGVLDYNNANKIRCDRDIHIKMFDDDFVPKYIIGKDYKIIPINPSTTHVLVNGCTWQHMLFQNKWKVKCHFD